tara:strand:- start:40 stop:846 length:807 start_codon:yes stop_codon:yes gene_type:complete
MNPVLKNTLNNSQNDIKISIITIVYNNEFTVGNTINSVISQEYANIEYIVIDGQSTDGTKKVIKKYGNKINLFISEPDKGMYDALNKGISYATGSVIGFLHADDIFAHNKAISLIANRFIDPCVDVVYSDLDYVRKGGLNSVVRHWEAGVFSNKKLKNGWMPPHPTLYVRNRIYKKIGVFNLDYNIAADYDLMLRILNNNKINIQYIPEVLVNMSIGGVSNNSLRNIFVKSCEDYKALKSNNIGGLKALLLKNTSKLKQLTCLNMYNK